MRFLLKGALVLVCLCLLSALALTASLTYFAWRLEPKVEMTLRAVHAAADESALTAQNIRETSAIWKKASADQSSAITSAARGVTAAARQLSASASGVEQSSTAFLSELTQDAHEQNTALLANQRQLQTNLREIQGATGELRQTLQDADRQINDPAIGETLASLKSASQSASAGLDEANKSLTDVHQIADKARETYLKPINLWWAVFKQVLGIGPPIVTAIR